ncbi:organic hydroperoxide resistance protein [Mycoplana sp. MJR14]|jgi:Ohr subfamily peroxiredoxin|uniref:organic hydroperoxide resistance protein n=1 Tax=Mycoplana sp. MJR14 TaxID=3032583 RepID=UPI0023DBF6EF|nr:organic hydroperoxide resistance protein [Mycoplana sp. MJR14]MDF1631271.1 organic hydroperoxide resistance protein [Mycoplana sp. MJR14]
MDQQWKVIYTAKTHVSGGREHGVGRSSDGQLDVKFGLPGTTKEGTNPEQLFAAGWSACFESAIGILVQQKRIKLSGDVTIDAEVDLNLSPTSGYSLTARLAVGIPGVDRQVAHALVEEAHQICPYSKATRGNIDVAITLV